MTSAENKTQNVFDCFIIDYTSTSLIAGLNKYTSKELQTGEFDPNLSTGLEMFDFGSRFYDPQLGRWSIHDPAMQFSNPYLGIANNPVNFTDPDGEFAWAIGAAIGGITGLIKGKQAGLRGNDLFGYIFNSATIGGLGAGIGAGIGSGVGSLFGSGGGFFAGAAAGGAGGISSGALLGGMQANLDNKILGTNIDASKAAWKGALTGLGVGAVSGGLASGFSAKSKGRDFWNGKLFSKSPIQNPTNPYERSLYSNMEKLQNKIIDDELVFDTPEKLAAYIEKQDWDNMLINEDSGLSMKNHWQGHDIVFSKSTGRVSDMESLDLLRTIVYKSPSYNSSVWSARTYTFGWSNVIRTGIIDGVNNPIIIYEWYERSRSVTFLDFQIDIYGIN